MLKTKIKYSLFVLTICFCHLTLTAQNKNIDSLLTLLKNDKADTNRVIHLNQLTDEYRLKGDFEKGLNYETEALTLAHKLNFKKGIARASNTLAIIYCSQADYPRALDYYLKTLKIQEELKNKNGIAALFGNIGIVYSLQSDYKKALDYYFKALKMAEELANKNLIGSCLGQIGIIYNRQGDYPKALNYYFKALAIKEKIGDKAGTSNTLGNIGNAYKDQKNFPIALDYYFKALKMKEELGDKYGIAINLGNIGSLFTTTGKFNQAEHYLKIAIALDDSTGTLDMLSQDYEYLSQLYDTIGRHKEALIFYKKAIALRDTVFSQENKKQLVRKEMNYEFDKKEMAAKALQDKKDAAAEEEKQMLDAQIQKKNIVAYTSILGAFLIIVLIFLLFNRRLLKQKNKHQAEINKQQKDAGLSIIQAQEKEQERIAKDLHDGIGTFLSILKINLQLFEKYIPEEKFSDYQSAGKMIDQISDELRNIMKNLSNETLKEYGLVKAFEELTARVNRLGAAQIDFHSHGFTNRLDDVIEINLYRVGQELLNNCIKYSQAGNAALQLIEHNDNIMLLMEDNGAGFDTQNPKPKNKNHGMGLKNIRDRISFFKGKMQIDSTPNRGTTVTIEIPKY